MTRRIGTLLALSALAIAACGDPADTGGTVLPTNGGDFDPSDLADTSWQVVSFGLDGADDAVLPQAVPTIVFGVDGLTVGGTTGCNSYGATANSTSDTGITISDLVWTEMACMDDGVMDQEQRFLQALTRIDGFALDADSLLLDAFDGSAVIRAEAPTPGPILPLGGAWRLTTFIDGDVATSLLSGTEITLVLDVTTGEISGNAGCNAYSGALDIGAVTNSGAGASFTVGPVATTLMACAGEVMDQESMFHAFLGDATTVVADAGHLTMATDDGRSLVFEPAGE